MFNDPGLSWSQLRAFDACVRLKSFGTAAVKLSMSASAIRFQISLLENRLGVTLFERQGGSLALTDIGRNFSKQIARPLQELLTACETAQKAASDAAFTLTAPPLFARRFLLVEPMLSYCDANGLRLDVSDNKRDLLGPGLIAAIRLGTEDHHDLACTKILDVELCIAAVPQIAAGARPSDPDWWAAQTLLTPSASENEWKTAQRLLQVAAAPSPRMLSFSSYAAALEAACAGSGLILAPLPFAEREFVAGSLNPISNLRIQSQIGYSLIMRKEIAASRRGRALVRVLTRICRNTV